MQTRDTKRRSSGRIFPHDIFLYCNPRKDTKNYTKNAHIQSDWQQTMKNNYIITAPSRQHNIIRLIHFRNKGAVGAIKLV